MLKNSTANKFINEKLFYHAHITLKKLKQNFKNSKNLELKSLLNLFAKFANKNKNKGIDEILVRRTEQILQKEFTTTEKNAINEIKNSAKQISKSSKEVIKLISELKPNFRKTEKKIFKKLKQYSKKYPNESIFEIINKPEINKKHLKNLEIKQLTILDQIKDLAQKYDAPLQEKILEAVKKSKEIFKGDNTIFPNKRSKVLETFHKAFEDINFTTEKKEIIELVDNLPSSSTDVDAFFVKYQHKNTNSMIETLIRRIANTNEHVKPHHRVNDNGISDKSNYISLCGKCNHKRQRTQYDIFLETNSQMVENSQSQINQVIKYINAGKLIQYDDYPETIKKALDIESNHNIVINTEKLDKKLASINRKKRRDAYIEKKLKEHYENNLLYDKN
jgi:hypothetical protein